MPDPLNQSSLKVPHPYIAMVPQWDLLTLLAEAGAEEPSYTLRMRTEVTELIRESGRVHGVRYRTDDGRTGEVRADLTVACDGRWSIARRQGDLRPKELPVPLDVWWFGLPRMPGDNPAALTPVAGRGRFVLVIPREDFLRSAPGGFGRRSSSSPCNDSCTALSRCRSLRDGGWVRRSPSWPS